MGVKRRRCSSPTQACHGTFVMAIDSEEEINRLRAREEEKLKASAKASAKKISQRQATAPTSFQELWKR
jgi:hypothetical protein